jgi:hypothetical protein
MNDNFLKKMEEFGFKICYDVSCRNTIVDLFRPASRCGIYMLRFNNDEYYIGQAIDVVRRFNQHKQNFDDIIGLYFQQTPRTKLNSLEADLIGKIEQKNIPLRNISLTSVPPSESDLDLLISKEEQNLWLQGQKILDDYKRTDDESQRRKYSKKFAALEKDTTFQREIIPFLKKYIDKSIICPNRTERSFWAVSCLPISEKDYEIFLRINIYKQEVLTIGKVENSFLYSFHLTDSVFNALAEEEVKQRYFKTFSTFSVNDHFYKSGGMDQINILIEDGEEARSILDDEYFIQAVRTMNYRLMKKGATYFNRYHCFQIVDSLK